jgi:hypothetical protein
LLKKLLSVSQGTVTVKVYGSGAEGCEENDLIAPTLQNSTRELLCAKYLTTILSCNEAAVAGEEVVSSRCSGWHSLY